MEPSRLCKVQWLVAVLVDRLWARPPGLVALRWDRLPVLVVLPLCPE